MRKQARIEALREKPRHDVARAISIAPMMDWNDDQGLAFAISALRFQAREL